MKPNVFILMGVSATGKTSVGEALVKATGGAFFDGDDYHPVANREKMASGQALNDEDRKPWLKILAELAAERDALETPSFIACSALKESYREILRSKVENLGLIHLHVDPEILRERITARYEAGEHFMPPSLLDSQLEALEMPEDALVCDVSKPLEEVVEGVLDAFPYLVGRD